MPVNDLHLTHLGTTIQLFVALAQLEMVGRKAHTNV